jgi:KEOPS complex subunit Cgi121
MLFQLEEYVKTIQITGYRNINFTAAEAYLKGSRQKTRNVDIQFYDADLIATHEHLYFAALNALAAFKANTNISKSLAMETILYASAQRQIQKAIQHAGIKPESKNMAVLIIGGNAEEVELALREITEAVGVVQEEAVLELTEVKTGKIKKAFCITEQELLSTKRGKNHKEAVVALVIERLALLSTQL